MRKNRWAWAPLAGAMMVAGLLPAAANAQSVDGKAAFDSNCAVCHQADGKGIAGAFPALAGSAVATGPAEAAIGMALNGKGAMPPIGASLSDDTVAAILTYVRSSWGNKAAAVTAAQVKTVRGSK